MSKYIEIANDGSLQESNFVSQGGAGNANKPVQLNTDGFIDPTMLADSEVKSGLASEAIMAKQYVYFKADGTVAKASAAVGGHLAQGWAGNSASVGQSVVVYSEGTLGGLSGLTAEAHYYLSATTPGAHSATPPTGAGERLQVIGTALSATELNFTNDGIVITRA